MHVPTRPLAALAAVLVLALTGCGDDGTSGDSAGGGETENTAARSPTQSPTPSDDNGQGTGSNDGDDSNDDGAVEVEVEVTIEDGQTTPAGERITVKPGQNIRLTVDSDTADELHVHSDPEHSFEVKPTDDQTFEFAIDRPGVYEMESHETGGQVISIQVQP